MARLIDAEQFRGKHDVAEVNGKLNSVICYADIVAAPTVDAVEVVHGRFELIEKAGVDYWRCSACQEIVADYYYKPKHNYCPNCGAKMDLEVDNERTD